jgi:hypothetical protein
MHLYEFSSYQVLTWYILGGETGVIMYYRSNTVAEVREGEGLVKGEASLASPQSQRIGGTL